MYCQSAPTCVSVPPPDFSHQKCLVSAERHPRVSYSHCFVDMMYPTLGFDQVAASPIVATSVHRTKF